MRRFFVQVHVASLAADEGFVNFDVTVQLAPMVSSCMARRMRWSMNHAVF